jgi:hypothetical protein
VVPDVLGRMEHFEGEPVQEVPCREQASHRPQREACLVLEVVTDVLKLRDAMCPIETDTFHVSNDVVVCSYGILLSSAAELLVDVPPRLDFLARVLYEGQLVSMSVFLRLRDDKTQKTNSNCATMKAFGLWRDGVDLIHDHLSSPAVRFVLHEHKGEKKKSTSSLHDPIF